jgi:hydrogenase maturation protease
LNIVDPESFDYLIIGYGNPLRGDDGVGQQVTEAVQQWQLPRVRAIAVHQLTPDLAVCLSQTQTVIFVDAVSADPQTLPDVRVESLTPASLNSFTGHFVDPRSLLTLAQKLYHHMPAAYQILIPAICFEFSETLSPMTQNGMALGLQKIKTLIPNLCEDAYYRGICIADGIPETR